METDAVQIEGWGSCSRDAWQRIWIDQIFFASSAVQQFANAAERAAFRDRWFGRYLLSDAANAFVAVETGSDRIVGYVIGSLDDPGRTARFADLATSRSFAAASARYPAHLHINVDAEHRSRGIGERLIEAFCRHAAGAGAAGVHVITSDGSRNVRFYARCGFEEIARLPSGGGAKVFLGWGFSASPSPAIKD